MLAQDSAMLDRQLAMCEKRFLAYYATPSFDRIEQWYKLEGVMSHAWQMWCEFCRRAVIKSCLGTTTFSGSITRPQPHWVDEGTVCYEAKAHAYRNNIRPGHRILQRREEFTWGDVGRLVSAISGLSPTNRNTLISGFGVGLNAPRHMQTVRNASAHWNQQTFADVRRLAAYYSGQTMRHPTEIMMWSEISTRTPAFVAWTRDLRIMANASIQ